jgi:DNA-directed RNA polymerase specialized sigma24 family protein
MINRTCSQGSFSILEQKRLEAFNQKVLRFQDEMFTLAYYLTCDEKQAAVVAREACIRCFQEKLDGTIPFRLALLKKVIRCSRHFPLMASAEGSNLLKMLNDNDRQAVLLVDILGLSYEEAAMVLDCPEGQIARHLSQARLSLVSV